MAREATCLVPGGTSSEVWLVAQTSGSHHCWGCCSTPRKPHGWLLKPHRKPQRGNKATCNEGASVTPFHVFALSPKSAAPTPPWLVTPLLPIPSGCPLSERAARLSPSPGSCTEPPTPWRRLSLGGGEGPRAVTVPGGGLPGACCPTVWGCGVRDERSVVVTVAGSRADVSAAGTER